MILTVAWPGGSILNHYYSRKEFSSHWYTSSPPTHMCTLQNKLGFDLQISENSCELINTTQKMNYKPLLGLKIWF